MKRDSLKIVHVTQHLGMGGLEKIIFHLISEQKKLGHEVYLYVYDYDRSWVPYFEENGIEIIKTPLKNAGYDFSLLKRMNIDLMKFDVINTHDLNPLMYLSPLYFFRNMLFKKCPKLIHTTHGLGHVDRFPIYKFYEKIMTWATDSIICVSKKIEQFYLEQLHVKKDKVKLIENGINISSIEINNQLKQKYKAEICQQYQLDINKPLILSLSRIVALKNQLFLSKAIANRPDCQLLIVGPNGDDTYFNQLKLSLKKNIVLAGPQNDIEKYNIASDLYVSASTHEGLPVAVLEAISLKTPTLISDIPGHMNLNQKNKITEIFENNNEEDFLKKVDNLLKEKNDQALIENSIYVKEHYSAKAMTLKYLSIYKGENEI